MPGTPGPRRWLFLGVLIDVLTEPGAPVTVAQAVVPEGASPPAHVHAALDDSFYILDGRMVLHCGDDVWQAGPGSWVQFPAGIPHTFRVLGGPARILMVHADDSFLAAVRQIGRPATETDFTEITQDLTIEELDRAFATHGITNVGPPMEQAEAERLLGQLTSADQGGNPVAVESPGSIRCGYVLMSHLPGVLLDTVRDQVSAADRG